MKSPSPSLFSTSISVKEVRVWLPTLFETSKRGCVDNGKSTYTTDHSIHGLHHYIVKLMIGCHMMHNREL